MSSGLIPYWAAKPSAIGAMIATAPGLTAPTAVSTAAMREHDPWDRRDPAAHGTDGELDQPVDGAVVLRQREQVGDADQGQEQAAREAGDDVLGRHAGHQRADQERAHEGEHAHVDGQDRGDDEHRAQRENGKHLRRHRFLSPIRLLDQLRPAPLAGGGSLGPLWGRRSPRVFRNLTANFVISWESRCRIRKTRYGTPRASCRPAFGTWW